MNYFKIYLNLCRRGHERDHTTGNGVSKIVYEKHHVFPISIFGKNNFTVKLTAREHFVAHKCLVLIYKKRYSVKHNFTRKMMCAVHKMVYRLGNNNKVVLNSKDYAYARQCVRDAKLGNKREDMKGKKYFGADEETIKIGIQKMVQNKTGQKINYPTTRKARGAQTELTKKIISDVRLKTLSKYSNMTQQEFEVWVSEHNLHMKDGRKNTNVTRAIMARNEPIEKYYKK